MSNLLLLEFPGVGHEMWPKVFRLLVVALFIHTRVIPRNLETLNTTTGLRFEDEQDPGRY